MGTIEIVVPEVAPSLNKLVRLHWVTRRRLLDKWKWILFAEAYRLGAGRPPKGKMAVKIIRRSHHRLDTDNLHGAAKIVLDAMKAASLIADDNPDVIALTCEQSNGTPQTTIQVSLINSSLPEQELC